MRFRVVVWLAIACFLALGASQHPATEHPAAAAGIYEANLRIKGTAGRKVTLNLMQDGKATMRSELVGKDTSTESGDWSASGDEVRVVFSGANPHTLAWRLKKGRLIPADKSGLTLRRPR